MIRCYVINLKRRSDRLKNITQHLKLRGLSFIRFNAVDALNASKDILMNNMDISGPLGEVSSGDRACFQSHFNLWKLIAVKEKEPVLVLEDDVFLAENVSDLLKDFSWIPKGTKIIKCERFGNKRHRILVSPLSSKLNNYKIYLLLSKHSGTGGYIITPEGAKFLIEQKLKVNISVDHYLFNPNNSPVFKKLNPLQILPALCEQSDQISDIHPLRPSFNYLRELKRGYYEINLLPKHLFYMVFKGAKLIKPEISK